MSLTKILPLVSSLLFLLFRYHPVGQIDIYTEMVWWILIQKCSTRCLYESNAMLCLELQHNKDNRQSAISVQKNCSHAICIVNTFQWNFAYNYRLTTSMSQPRVVMFIEWLNRPLLKASLMGLLYLLAALVLANMNVLIRKRAAIRRWSWN